MSKKKQLKILSEFTSFKILKNEDIRSKIAELDLLDIIKYDSLDFSQKFGITDVQARNLIKEAKDNITYDIETAAEINEKRKTIIRLKTGCNAIDEITKGGLETQALIEFYGEFASGKTQLLHQLAVLAQKPIEEGGLNTTVVYIDTENTFRPDRLMAIATRFKMNCDKILDNTFVIKPRTSDEQIAIVEKLLDGSYEQFKKKQPRLLIIDSVIAFFRSEYIGRGTLSERQQKLNKHLQTCKNFAQINNGIVLLSNQVMSTPDVTFFGPILKPTGGHVLAHATNYRFFLKKSVRNKRIISIMDAPDLEAVDATYEIFEGGIKDIDTKISKENMQNIENTDNLL